MTGLSWSRTFSRSGSLGFSQSINLQCVVTQSSLTQLKQLKEVKSDTRSAVGNMCGNRCESDCRSRGREFDPGPVPYFRGDWSWNNFYGHSPPFRWIIQEGLLSVTSESMCTKYWLTACSSLPRKSVVRWTDRPAMTIAVDLGRKATNKQTNKSYTDSIQTFEKLQRSLRTLYLEISPCKWSKIDLRSDNFFISVCGPEPLLKWGNSSRHHRPSTLSK